MNNKLDCYQEVTNKIIKLMETHGSNWCKPWESKGLASGMPFSVTSKAAYSGINVVLLWAEGFGSSEWGTFKAWQAKGAKIRKGEKGTPIIFFKQLSVKDKDTDEKKMIPMIKQFYVFNAEQVEGYEPGAIKTLEPLELLDNAEQFINNTQAIVHRVAGDRAFYRPSTDDITVPLPEQFKGETTEDRLHGYYGTMLHELTHWTGSKKRLDRLSGDPKDTRQQSYAKEELIAELGAAFLCAELGIASDPREDHAQYLNSWLKALKNDKKLIVKAASQARKACDFLKDLQPKAKELSEAA
tara:strand:- start:62 stop:955 length:894 start_codon:yes stop_codon:yes gene_type:complete